MRSFVAIAEHLQCQIPLRSGGHILMTVCFTKNKNYGRPEHHMKLKWRPGMHWPENPVDCDC